MHTEHKGLFLSLSFPFLLGFILLFYLDHVFMYVEVLLDISMHLSLPTLRLPLSGHLPKQTLRSGVHGAM